MEELFNEFVNEHLFKLSVGVGVAYAGVLIAMGIDFVFGVKKARQLKKRSDFSRLMGYAGNYRF